MLKDLLIRFSIGPILSALIGLILVPLAAWIFSPSDLGSLALLQTLISLFVLLFSFGLDQAYLRSYEENVSPAFLFKNTFYLSFLGLVLFLGLLLITFPNSLVGLVFAYQDIKLNIIIFIAIICSLVVRFNSIHLRAISDSSSVNWILVAPKFLYAILLLTFMLFISDPSLNKLVYAFSSSIIFAAFLGTAFNRKLLLASLKSPVSVGKIKDNLAYGLPLVLSGLASWSLFAVDRISIQWLSSLNELGVYAVATSFAAAAALFAGIINTVLAPYLFKLHAEGRLNAAKINGINDYISLFFVCTISVFGLTSWIVPYLLPESYHNIEGVNLCCVTIPLLYTLGEVSSAQISIVRRTKLIAIATSLAALINLLFNFLLIPSYAAAGAAVASCLSFWVLLLLKMLFAKSVWGRVQNKKMLFFASISIFLAIIQGLRIFDNQGYPLLWISMLCAAFWFYRNTLKALIRGLLKE